MLVRELFESVVTTSSALSQLVDNANSMYTLYVDTLPDRVNNLYAKGEHEDMYRTAKNVVGRTKGKWFADNYMSTSRHRNRPTTGLKEALLALAKDPMFQSSRGRLHQLGSFTVMLNKEQQMEVGGSGGQYVSQLEMLPDLMEELSNRAPGQFRDKLTTTARRLRSAIENFYSLWERLQKKWNEDWGSSSNTREQDTTRRNERQSQGSQMNQAELIVAQVLKDIPDRKVADDIRRVIARSDNKLVALQQELNRRGIKV